jgi:hypothetical protein
MIGSIVCITSGWGIWHQNFMRKKRKTKMWLSVYDIQETVHLRPHVMQSFKIGQYG